MLIVCVVVWVSRFNSIGWHVKCMERFIMMYYIVKSMFSIHIISVYLGATSSILDLKASMQQITRWRLCYNRREAILILLIDLMRFGSINILIAFVLGIVTVNIFCLFLFTRLPVIADLLLLGRSDSNILEMAFHWLSHVTTIVLIWMILRGHLVVHHLLAVRIRLHEAGAGWAIWLVLVIPEDGIIGDVIHLQRWVWRIPNTRGAR